MKVNFLLMSAFTLSITACASLSQKFEADRAQKIKKVAIVAFEIQQQVPTDNLAISGLMNLAKGGTPEGSSPEMLNMAKKASQNFAAELQKETKWQVLPMSQVLANPAYAQKVAAAMQGLRDTMPQLKNSVQVVPTGALDVVAFRKMSSEEKTQLAKSLGVDALAEVLIHSYVDQSWISLGHASGTAPFSAYSIAHLQLFATDWENPVWRSQNVRGEKTESSETLPENYTRLQRMSAIGEKSTSLVTQKLMQTFPL